MVGDLFVWLGVVAAVVTAWSLYASARPADNDEDDIKRRNK